MASNGGVPKSTFRFAPSLETRSRRGIIRKDNPLSDELAPTAPIICTNCNYHLRRAFDCVDLSSRNLGGTRAQVAAGRVARGRRRRHLGDNFDTSTFFASLTAYFVTATCGQFGMKHARRGTDVCKQKIKRFDRSPPHRACALLRCL